MSMKNNSESHENQVKNKQKWLKPGISHENRLFFDQNIENFLSGLSRTECRIAEVILSFRTADHICMTNKYIAERANCSVRSVVRTTNKLRDNGFLIKYQENKYAPNEFKLSHSLKKGRHAYSYWINTLSAERQEHIMLHELHSERYDLVPPASENVTQSNNYINYIYLSNNPIPHNACARAWLATESQTVIDGDGEGFLTKQERERKEHVKRGLKMISDLQKEWLLANGSDPRVQDLMNNESIRSALITPEIEELTTLLSLNNREQFKLIAFGQDALKYVLTFVRPVVEGTKKTKEPIRDRMGWLMSMLLNYCKQRHIAPDWNFYYKLCEITKIPKLIENEEPRPLVVKFKQRTKNLGWSPYDTYKKKVVVPDERIEFLKEEIEKCTLLLQDPVKSFNEFARESSITFCKNQIEACTEELNQLFEQNNKRSFQQSIATA